MKIWIARHGQTNLNKIQKMQGHTDEPLNETGIAQAHAMRELIGDVHFDAVYASPLQRAIKTASILGDIPESDIQIDPRIIEVSFGKYELRRYQDQGIAMTAFWMLPEVFPAPDTVETIAQMKNRTTAFLQELEQKDYNNVLVTCHGGIMRVLCGYLINSHTGLMWRPRPENCEMRIFEDHHMIQRIYLQ